MKKMFLAAAAASVMISSAAMAAWHIDADGYGFVGKGDVQLALNYNNAQLQQNAESLSFTYEDTATYEIVCEKENRRNTVTKHFQRTRTINATVDYEARRGAKGEGQVNGFNLTGWVGSPALSGSPLVCPTNNDPNDSPGDFTLISGPTLISSTGGQLKVNGVTIL